MTGGKLTLVDLGDRSLYIAVPRDCHQIVPNRAHRAAREPRAPPLFMSWMQRFKRVFRIDTEHSRGSVMGSFAHPIDRT